MFGAWMNMAMLAAESQRVIGLRLMKLAVGGTGAVSEANLMVSEKMDAVRHAAGRLLLGDTHDSVVTGYRTTVQANIRRLSKPKATSKRRRAR